MASKSILLIEDDVINRRLMKFLLRSHGYDVWEVTTASAAFALLAERHPDLILMDIRLPGMDGLAATRIIKAEPSTRGIPVVAVTSYAMSEDEAKAREAGCCGYITKPIEKARLLEVIAQALTQGSCPEVGLGHS